MLDPAERAVLRIAGEEQPLSLSGGGMKLCFLNGEGSSELRDAVRPLMLSVVFVEPLMHIEGCYT